MSHVYRLIRTYVMPRWPIYLLGLLAAVAESLLAVRIPALTKEMVDIAVAHTGNVGAVGGALFHKGLILLAIGAIKSIDVFFEIYIIEMIAEGVSYRLRRDLYDKVQRLSFSYHDSSRTGELMSRMTSDVQAMRDLSGFGIGMLVYNGVVISVVVSRMVSYNAPYAAVSLATLPILLVVVLRYSKVSGPAFTSIQEQIASMTAFVQERVSGIRVVKAFAREGGEAKDFERENDLVVEKNMVATRINAFYQPFMDFLATAGTVTVVWYGGRLYMKGALTPGDITGFLSYLWLLIWPIRAMSWVVGMYQRGVAGAKRVFEILDTPVSVAEPRGAIELPRLEGKVEFRDVHFSYSSGDRVLDGLSLCISPGQTVGVLGMTGSGKSTIAALIPRFYDVRQGQILVDGYDVREVTLTSLRRQIGIVPQDTFLFSATIRENIAYFDPDADLGKVIEAAKVAHIHEFIESLEDGYETVIGERGLGLSGGQRQRVALARAIMLDPRILILDDSTASVDAETEKLIQESLRSVARGRTTIIISQKVSSVRYADLIVVLKDGRIAESGSHEELYALGGDYRRLCDAQSEVAASDGESDIGSECSKLASGRSDLAVEGMVI